MSRPRVLLLGGAGFIGFGIASFLAGQRNCDLTIADQFSPGQKDSDFNALSERHSVTLIEGDFTDPALFDCLETDYDHVYMLAAVVGVNRCLEHPEEVIRINTALTANTLAWLRRSRVGRVLFASSSECYAGTTTAFNYPVPTAEDVPLCVDDIRHPRATYAVTKMLGESAFLSAASRSGFEATVVRYQNVFGPRMGFRHVIPHLVERFLAKSESPFQIYGAYQTRAFCYISDSAEGSVLAMESPRAAGEIYHIGATDEISIETLVHAVGDIMGYRGRYVQAPSYPGSVARRCPDISKARSELGYRPRVPWREGLARTVSWYRRFFESGAPIPDGGFAPPGQLSYRKAGNIL